METKIKIVELEERLELGLWSINKCNDNKDGKPGENGEDAKDGKDGKDGKPGENGKSTINGRVVNEHEKVIKKDTLSND
jgi:hypothetical protein